MSRPTSELGWLAAKKALDKIEDNGAKRKCLRALKDNGKDSSKKLTDLLTI
jgi:hypothetical protein